LRENKRFIAESSNPTAVGVLLAAKRYAINTKKKTASAVFSMGDD